MRDRVRKAGQRHQTAQRMADGHAQKGYWAVGLVLGSPPLDATLDRGLPPIARSVAYSCQHVWMAEGAADSDLAALVTQTAGADEVQFHGVDIAHVRLPELAKLADAAQPFYVWVETVFRDALKDQRSLGELILVSTELQLRTAISSCYQRGTDQQVPALLDGIGRQYAHRKACFYFFSWLARDAPQQRLQPLLTRASKQAPKGTRRIDLEAQALALLLVEYREAIGTFSWTAAREVIMDRLEGSRRAIKGHMQEVVVRTAVTAALQAYHSSHKSYGRFAKISVSEGELRVGNETFDVAVELVMSEGSAERLLIPVKSRETEGGGHSHLFTRDIGSAIQAVRTAGKDDWIVAFIIAQNWAARERETVAEMCDFTVSLQMSPNQFAALDQDIQTDLNRFITSVLDGTISPKVRNV